jgi:glycosyltransferase involved in cell wall biosynthesis
LNLSRILVLTSSFPRFQGDHFGPWILEYYKETVKNGIKVNLLAPNANIMDLKKLSNKNLKITRFNYFFPLKYQGLVVPPGIVPNIKKDKSKIIQVPFLFIHYLIEGIKEMKRNDVQLIHSQWVIPSGMVGLILAKIFNKPHVITSQGAEFFFSKYNPLTLFVGLVIRSSDYLFAVSSQMAEKAIQLGMNPKNVVIMPNAVNTDKFKVGSTKKKIELGIPENHKVILTVRRLVSEKRVEDVIIAFADFINKNQIKDYHLIIGGDGPEYEKLVKLTNALNLDQYITFLGFVDNDKLPEIYSISDIYILSSQQEGLSLTLLEAMSSENVIVSTSSTGGSDVIKESYNGFLYQVGDTTQLSKILLNISKLSQNELNDLKFNARKTITEQFSTKVMIKKSIQYYEKAISKNRLTLTNNL